MRNAECEFRNAELLRAAASTRTLGSLDTSRPNHRRLAVTISFELVSEPVNVSFRKP